MNLPGDVEDPESMAPFVRVGRAAIWWIGAEHRRERMLHGQLREICKQEAAQEIMKLVASGVDAIAKMRSQSDEYEPSAELARAA